MQNLRSQDLVNQERELAPLRQNQQQIQVDLLEAQQPVRIQQADLLANPESQLIQQQQQQQQIATNYATAIRPLLNNPDALVAELNKQKAVVSNLGLPTQSIDDDIAQAQTPEGRQLLSQEVNTVLSPISNIGRTAGQREFDSLVEQARSSDEDLAKAAKIKLGISPRATGSSAITTATTEGLTEQVAKSEKIITEAEKEGELSARKKLEPSVKSAVTDAIFASKIAAEKAKTDKTNQRAFDVYQVGIDGLTNGLGLTETGPLVGRLPALTANQQIADGAVAAMAPILKQMFRSAGEGIFTDKDQELLLRMIPTRTDRKASIESKLANIDAIVRAKLGQSSEQQAQPSTNVIRFDAQGNIIQ